MVARASEAQACQCCCQQQLLSPDGCAAARQSVLEAAAQLVGVACPVTVAAAAH